MLRCVLSACGALRQTPFKNVNSTNVLSNSYKYFSTSNLKRLPIHSIRSVPPLANDKRILAISNSLAVTPIRTLIKYDLTRGKGRSNKAVLQKFYRLDWGGWIRTKAGRNKRRWKKSSANKRRAFQHVLCNATQCTLLDKMVSTKWKKPKYFIDDPYEPYHTREEFWITRRKPREF